jgi:phosphoribosylamine--glycine ligase
MRVLVIGSGAREHAIVAKLSADATGAEIVCAPGNPGIARLARTRPADPGDVDQLTALVDREQADFTIVGPELPLSLGLVDRLTERGRLVFGPTAAAARLESSKAFAKAFMTRQRVPTARFRIATSLDDALAILRSRELGLPVVLKADGLAAGKGVVIAETMDEADAAATAAMGERRFGDAGATLVVEECLSGPEVSFFVIADGTRAVPIGTAQDHKRIFDADRGPNTGGMGAFAPSPLVDAPLADEIMRGIVNPVIAGMASEGCSFRGFLYVGLMLTSAGPRVIEFNVRLGDPEAQVVLPRMAEPLLPLLMDAAAGHLERHACTFSADRLVGVVLASRGYPEGSEAGRAISGIENAEQVPGVSVYHAGTATREGSLVSAGGRVLTVVGRGHDFPDAIASAYAGVAKITFEGMQYRRDIGQKALIQVR